MRTSLLIFLFLSSIVGPVAAQTTWARPYEPNQITIEALVPDLPADEPTGLSGGTFLSATYSLNDNVESIFELPVARYGGAPTATALGNPYVGLGLSSTTAPVLVEVGVRIPAGPTNRARRVGRHADPGRTAAFRDETISLSALLNGRLALSRSTSLRLRAGLSYGSVRTGSGTQGDWQIPYSAQLWREGDWFLTGLSITGRPSFRSFTDDAGSTHHAVLSVMLDGDTVQPGLLAGAGLDPLFTDGRVDILGGITLSISYSR